MLKLGAGRLSTTLPVQGRIRDLNIQQAGPGGVECLFTHEGATTDHHALTYANGILAAVDSDGISAAGGLPEGNININVIPQLEYEPMSPLFFDDTDGRRVLLSWAPSTGNIAGYNIYTTDTDGLNETLTDTITRRHIQKAFLKYPDTGTGLGRISTPETPVSSDIYGILNITITGEGAFTWTVGDESGTGEFTRGATVYLAAGIGIYFDDDPAEYDTGDEYELAAGPTNRWLSSELAPWFHRFGITAFNDDGSESSMTLTAIQEIVTQSDPVSVITETLVGTVLTIAFTLPTGAASVNLYSNFDEQLEEFLTHTTLTPVDNSPTSFTIDFGSQEGTFKYYLRPVTAAGVELQDFTLYEFAIPEPAEALGTPENLTGEPVGVLNWTVSWNYTYQSADALVDFSVLRNGVIVGTVTPDTIDVEGITESFTYTETAETEPAGELTITIQANSLTGTATSDPLTITTNASVTVTAPGAINGGAA